MMELGSLLMYLIFAMLTGGVIIMHAPQRVRTGLQLKSRDISWMALCVPVVTFIPLWEIYLSQRSGGTNIFQWERFIHWNLGQAWLASLVLSVALCFCFRQHSQRGWLKGMSFVFIVCGRKFG